MEKELAKMLKCCIYHTGMIRLVILFLKECYICNNR